LCPDITAAASGQIEVGDTLLIRLHTETASALFVRGCTKLFEIGSDGVPRIQ
jgi:hypothetical protein